MATTTSEQEPSPQSVLDLFSDFVSPGKVQYFRDAGIEFAIGRREGPYIWNVDGTHRLINCHCNGGVFNLGHRNPEVVAALRSALDTLDIGNHHFPSAARARLAERLAECAPGNLRYTVFGVSGGEAADAALKVARKATGRRKIVSAAGGYHGHTGLAVAAGAEKFSKPFLVDTSEFAQVPFNDIGAMEQVLDNTVAAVILETIPATLGMPIPDDDYLRQVKAICERQGAVYIADEVQTGLGRTGKVWGIEHYGVEPDILVTAKGLSGGVYPITATLLTPEMQSVFQDDPFSHLSTYGGAELGCVVAEKVLSISTDPAFLLEVNEVSTYLAEQVELVRENHHKHFLELRRKGMFMGLKMANEMLGPLMTKVCYDAGLLCIFAALDESVVQFLPPLIADAPLADEIAERLDDALSRLDAYFA